ncbi:MAG: enoyl-CoA hydratase/isomerase family protein [Syntrophomonadaceae bacterium]|jgi:enoyl-CoA hydratase|nr:enoyl-CoA hydratase/isomerase family protein [Syntrophomonadaceae bacterium]
MSNNFEFIDFSKDGAVGVITLNKPDTFNLLSHELFFELEDLQKEIESDQSIRAVVIRAAGRHFSYGTDLNALKAVKPEEVRYLLNRNQSIIHRWQEWPIPVIAAVQGRCFGGAVELILSCDIRVISEDCELTLPEVRLGLSPDLGGTTKLTKLVGIGQAKRMIMACETVSATEAYHIGLAEIVTPAGQLMERAMELARKMAGYPPLSVRFSKYGINLAAESSLKAGLWFEQAQSAACFSSEDMGEAISAFKEKRQPIFKG